MPRPRLGSRPAPAVAQPARGRGRDPAPGDVVAGRYRIVRTLGRNRGVLFEAFDQQLERRTALRLLAPTLADPKEVEHFHRELRLLSKLESPHAARVFDAGSLSDGTVYVAREYVEGESLLAYVGRRGALPLDEALYLFLQMCEATQEAHSYGIALRDLQLGHAFVHATRATGPVVKVTDFGASKLVRGSEGRDKESSCTKLLGLSPWASPELVRRESGIDRRADVWSLGAMLFHLVTGRPPFAGDGAALMMAIVHREVVPASRLRPDLPPELDEVLLRALKKDRTRRFPGVHALAEPLRPLAPADGRLLLDRVAELAGPEDSMFEEAVSESEEPTADRLQRAPQQPISARPRSLPPPRSARAQSLPPLPGPRAAFPSAAPPVQRPASMPPMPPRMASVPPRSQARPASMPPLPSAVRPASAPPAPPPMAQPRPASMPPPVPVIAPHIGERPAVALTPAAPPIQSQPLPLPPRAPSLPYLSPPRDSAYELPRWERSVAPPIARRGRTALAVAIGVAAAAVLALAGWQVGTRFNETDAAPALAAVGITPAVAVPADLGRIETPAAQTPGPRIAPVSAAPVKPARAEAPPPAPARRAEPVRQASAPVRAPQARPETRRERPVARAPERSERRGGGQFLAMVLEEQQEAKRARLRATQAASKGAASEPSDGETGVLSARAIGGTCSFAVDGVARGAGAKIKVRLAPGVHTVTCGDGAETRSRRVRVESGESVSAVFRF